MGARGSQKYSICPHSWRKYEVQSRRNFFLKRAPLCSCPHNPGKHEVQIAYGKQVVFDVVDVMLQLDKADFNLIDLLCPASSTICPIHLVQPRTVSENLTEDSTNARCAGASHKKLNTICRQNSVRQELGRVETVN